MGWLGALTTAAALPWAWVQFPPTLEWRGVTGFFTSLRLGQEGFIRTSPHVGMILGFLAFFAFLAYLGIKFGGGVFDFSQIEGIRKRVDPGGRAGEHGRVGRGPKKDKP